jgi:hypothetical protein
MPPRPAMDFVFEGFPALREISCVSFCFTKGHGKMVMA